MKGLMYRDHIIYKSLIIMILQDDVASGLNIPVQVMVAVERTNCRKKD